MSLKYKIFLALYIAFTVVTFISLCVNYGAFRAWMFGALACGLPALIDKNNYC